MATFNGITIPTITQGGTMTATLTTPSYNQGYQAGLAAAVASLNQANNGKTLVKFNMATDVQAKQIKYISRGIWTNDSATLATFFTSSAQLASQKRYYYQVWDNNPSLSGSLAQFSVAYGNRLGSGSLVTPSSTESPTQAIYSQMKLTVLSNGQSTFTFNSGSTTQTSDQLYVLSINRARIKDSLDPGNWQLALAQLNGGAYSNSVYTGSNVQVSSSNKVVTLIDDSSTGSAAITITNAGVRYNIISGTIGNPYVDANGKNVYYGYVYPSLGLMVFNGLALNQYLSFNSVTSSVDGDNAFKLLTSISGAAAINSTNYSFEARNSEKQVSSHYFVRLKNGDFNNSNNPTFVTGSDGSIRIADFYSDPQVFITSIGLYNDNYELLAVAKLSTPIIKNFDSELLVKVKLYY